MAPWFAVVDVAVVLLVELKSVVVAAAEWVLVGKAAAGSGVAEVEEVSYEPGDARATGEP